MTKHRLLTSIALLSFALFPVFAGAAAPTPGTAPAAASAIQPTFVAAAKKSPITTKVNLNTADAKELDTLPQIGPARVKAIVEARMKSLFKNWDDFVSRKVIPANAQKAIKDLVTF